MIVLITQEGFWVKSSHVLGTRIHYGGIYKEFLLDEVDELNLQ